MILNMDYIFKINEINPFTGGLFNKYFDPHTL